MSYTALYRKFRPASFEEVRGQDHIVGTLRNQIKKDRVGHAYLFCGTRGTGKTSVAKIFAKAVNCESPVDGSPCGKCKSCLSIADGSSMNVIEMDAASNSGVDDIRGVIEELSYAPTDAKYRVYIIDEVHALSGAAFNALLKSLEEPPAYVIFILATTEIHKVPQTIKSRCQRYDFHRISIATIADRLSELMRAEGIDVEERGLRYIARAADGSMRDALSLLEQCVGFYSEGTITFDNIIDILGAVDTEEFERLLSSVAFGDVSGAINAVSDIVGAGRDLTQFVLDFAWYLRNLLLIKTGGDYEDILDISSENLASMKEIAEDFSPQVLIRYIGIFSELADDMKYSGQKRTLLEIAVIRLAKPQMGIDYNDMLHRIEQLEAKTANGIVAAPSAVPVSEKARPASTQAAEPSPLKPLPENIPERIRFLCRDWKSIVLKRNAPRGFVAQALDSAYVSIDDDHNIVLRYTPDKDAAYGCLSDESNLAAAEKFLSEEAGCEVHLKVELNNSGRSNEAEAVDALEYFRNLGIDIETED